VRPDLLSTAAAQWQQAKQLKWSRKCATSQVFSCSLLPVMGKRLLVDIEARDIAKYQTARLAEAHPTGRSTSKWMLRQIMRSTASGRGFKRT